MISSIAVAMSGGIDSTFAAFKLKSQGHDVIGLHFITGFESSFQKQRVDYSPVKGEVLEKHIASVREQFYPLIETLKIPFEIVDLQSIFRSEVVDYFVNSYLKGETPNPCLVCNPAIKFGTLLKVTRNLGASHLATGHYARIEKDPEGDYHLLKGLDEKKDQSYFLSRLNQYHLSRALFPLGEMRKTDVTDILKKNNIFPISKEESQDICFINKSGYSQFLSDYASYPPQKGPIIDTLGKILGEHKGLHQFTIGQRKGINCPGKNPYYVVHINTEKNQLIVGEKSDLFSLNCKVRDINWVLKPVSTEVSISARVRYRHEPVQAKLKPIDEKNAHLTFLSPLEAVTPGQGAVFYMENEILGGGFIA